LKLYLFISLSLVSALLLEGSVLVFFMADRVLPDLILVIVICLGFILGEQRGALVGLVAGLLQDIVLGSVLGFFALAKMLLGYGAGLLGRDLYQDQLFAPALLVGLGTLTHETILLFLVNRFIGSEISVGWSVGSSFLLKTLYNMVLALLCYPLIYRLCSKSRFPDAEDTAVRKRF